MTSSKLRGDVAIVGMACLFPGAPDLDAYWQNIVSKTDAITDPPSDPWNPEVFFDPDSTANDRVYCKRGGYLGDLAQFNPTDYGIMPIAVNGGEPDQWLALHVAYAALGDAGYLDRPEERGRTEVILGKGTYLNRGNITVGCHGVFIEQTLRILRTLHPEHTEADLQAIKQELKASLPPFGADTAPALIGNIIAGRIANRLDLQGPSYTVDGACASALLAVEIGVGDLLSHKCDLALVGGVHVNTPVPTFMLFCQLGALSRRGQIRPFDQDADGTILGEGLGMVVLRRLEDATRDGDRIYAVIKGVGTSSDGRAVHVMAPRVEGEELALRLAYEMADISPRTVGLVEAHGTGTPVGDVVEIQALTRAFGERNGTAPWCALGSVKSMIGHTMPAAGVASLIKTALALYHKILPPTLNCERPNPRLELERAPFYINAETRPWIHGSDAPRRAGVNAFGFGGINAHVVLEEYPNNEDQARSRLLYWETEVCVLEGASREDLIRRAHQLQQYLDSAQPVCLKDLAYTLNTQLGRLPYRLAIVAASGEDLQRKVGQAVRRLSDAQCRQIKDVSGIYFFESPLGRQAKLAFLFPGEGAQYPNMLSDLALHFPEVRACFDLTDRAFVGHPRGYLPSDLIFPRPTFSDAERAAVEERFWQSEGAVEAVLIANWALSTLLSRLEIRPDVIVGHSTGDYSAMFASGVIGLADQASYSRTIRSVNGTHGWLSGEVEIPRAALAAVAADYATVSSIINRVEDVYVAMDNCPHQTVIVGKKAAVEQAVEHLRRRGVIYEFLPFDRPYHTPLFKPYADGWVPQLFSQLPISAFKIPIYSCTTVAPYPSDPGEILKLSIEHWTSPVRFRETIEAMYADGVRIFLEVGPRGNLTAFVDDILGSAPGLAVAANVARRSGITQLNHMVGVLAAQGVPMRVDYLYARRAPHRVVLEAATDAVSDRRKAAPTKMALGIPLMQVTPRTPATVPAERHQSPSRQPASSRGNDLKHGQPSTGLDETDPLTSLVAPGRVTPTSSPAMREYLNVMEDFLALQQEVMQAFLTEGEPAEQREQGIVEQPLAATVQPFPFLGSVTSFVPGQELVALRRLDKEEDLLLRAHTLGNQISLTDETLTPLALVPLTISMEILAEAAAALMPGRVLIGMKEIRAHRWIQVAEDPVSLEITARRTSPGMDEVEVYIRDLGREGRLDGTQTTPAIQGIMVFGQKYPEPPGAGTFFLTAERVSALASANLYDGELMFHGPCFQGVVSVDRSGQDGLVGQLQILPSAGLFRSTPNPRFVTDPVVLDAAGQLVGYWAAEHLERGFVVFPYRLEALHVYGPQRPAGERVTCRLRLERLGTKQIRSDLDIVGADGQLWMRLVGWEDMRFDVPERFYRFCVAPTATLMSVPCRTPIVAFPSADSFECYRLERLFEPGSALWKDLWASLILTQGERKVFGGLQGSEIRQNEWLIGRAAAKDAVRMFLKKAYQLELCPADIEVGQDEHGRPLPQGPWTRGIAVVPALSLAHTDGIAVAVAGHAPDGRRLGIDLEAVRPQTAGFKALAFTRGEQELLACLPASAREEWVIRFWCAKEAVVKALGRGLTEGPQSVELQALDAQTGVVRVALQGKLAEAFPEFAGARIVTNTVREGDHVIAATLCEREAECSQ